MAFLPRFPILDAARLKSLLDAAFPGAQVEVDSRDGVHFAARIVAAEFAGAGRVARHQRVYRALDEYMGGEVHALSLETLTPEEAATL